MAFALPEFFEGLGATESLFSTFFNAENRLQLQQNFLQNQNFQQLQGFGQQNAFFQLQANQQNTLQANQFEHNNSTLTTNFENSLALNQQKIDAQNSLEQGRFAQQNSLQETAFSNSLKSGAISSGFNLGGNLIESGINFALSKNLLETQASLQRENFDYTTGKAASAYQQAGLPTWLAYGGSANSFPHQTQQINGNNTFTSVLPGNSNALIWNGSASQLALGVGNVPQAQ